jgi:serine/threonine protein kinase
LYTKEKCYEHPDESEERFLLTDFGLSRPADDEDDLYSSERGGTGGYRAPELFDNKFGKRTDMFSFGCVMMDVASMGTQRAFKEDYEIRRYKEHDPNYPLRLLKTGVNTALDNLTLRDFGRWIGECLQRDPKKRPTAAELQAKMEKKLIAASED